MKRLLLVLVPASLFLASCAPAAKAPTVLPPAASSPSSVARVTQVYPPAKDRPLRAVVVQKNGFTPATLRIKKGTAVMWVNGDAGTHAVTGDTSVSLSGSLIGEGAFYSVRLMNPGTYAYHCRFHPSAKGTVEVTE
jgi:plastocyanin